MIDEALETKPKKCFPNWMRRLAPGLAAEDTNDLFQAFRARHEFLRHKSPLRYYLNQTLRILTAVVVSGMLAGFLLGAYRNPLVINFLIIGNALRFSVIRRTSAGHFPSSLTALFPPQQAAAVDLVRDLQQSTTTGRDVAEALSLEKALSIYLSIYSLVNLLVIGVLMYWKFVVLRDHGHPATFIIISHLLMIWMAADAIREALANSLMMGTRATMQTATSHIYRSKMQPLKQRSLKNFAAGGKMLVQIVGLGVLVILLLGAVFLLLTPLQTFLSRWMGSSFFNFGIDGFGVLEMFVWLLVVVILMWRRRTFAARAAKWRLAVVKQLEAAGDAFTAVMAAYSAEDDETREFAWNRYQHVLKERELAASPTAA